MIEAIWQVDHYTTFQKENIIPKGVIEIIFNFSGSDPIPAQLNKGEYHLTNCFINGFNTKPIQISLPAQQTFFGIIFQPLAIKKIFKVPASEFADVTIDLTLIDNGFHSLWHQLAWQTDFEKRKAVFINWAASHLIEYEPREHLLNNFLYAEKQHEMSVNELAASLCYSSRQLSRKIIDATGMNTEEILLYKKYLHAVNLVHHSNLSLTSISYQSKFADQSHFIKTFKAYAKMTPTDYKRNKSFVKGHLYDIVR